VRENTDFRRGLTPDAAGRLRRDDCKIMKDARIKVMIVGGGVAALEGLMALHGLAADRVSLELVTPTPSSRIGRWRSPSRSGSVRRTATTSCG
jgi:hypothetical protein